MALIPTGQTRRLLRRAKRVTPKSDHIAVGHASSLGQKEYEDRRRVAKASSGIESYRTRIGGENVRVSDVRSPAWLRSGPFGPSAARKTVVTGSRRVHGASSNRPADVDARLMEGPVRNQMSRGERALKAGGVGAVVGAGTAKGAMKGSRWLGASEPSTLGSQLFSQGAPSKAQNAKRARGVVSRALESVGQHGLRSTYQQRPSFKVTPGRAAKWARRNKGPVGVAGAAGAAAGVAAGALTLRGLPRKGDRELYYERSQGRPVRRFR